MTTKTDWHAEHAALQDILAESIRTASYTEAPSLELSAHLDALRPVWERPPHFAEVRGSPELQTTPVDSPFWKAPDLKAELLTRCAHAVLWLILAYRKPHMEEAGISLFDPNHGTY